MHPPRSSVLGKRSHQPETSSCDQYNPPTPDQTPKRVRTSLLSLDGDSNKENVPPFREDDLSPTSARTARALRRTATEVSSSPPRTRTTPRRHFSTSDIVTTPATPATAISHLTISTPPPTPPTLLLPIHARARALLRATCNNTTQMAGRVDEQAAIVKFLMSFLQSQEDDGCSSLYISGSPGTGKTAMVNSILRALDTESFPTRVISINCMALNNIDALWDRLLEEIDDGKRRNVARRVKKMKGRDAVKMIFAGFSTKCILILDELDHIAASPQSLTSLFSLPQTSTSNLRVIGIANTHTLTSSLFEAPATTETGVKTLHFAPYTPQQLLDILRIRLAPLYDLPDTGGTEHPKQFLPAPSLTLLTKKIAAQTGDVRSLFEVLRGAIDLAVTSLNSDTSENPLNSPIPAVTPAHVLASLKAYTPSSTAARSTSSAGSVTVGHSEIVTKVHSLGLQARLVLLSILLASKRLELGFSLSSSPAPTPKSPVRRTQSTPLTATSMCIEASQLHAFYISVLTRMDSGIFTPVSRSEFGDLLGMLEVAGLVYFSLSASANVRSSPSKGRRTFGRSASFGGIGGKSKASEVRMVDGVRGDEVLRGLGIAVDSTKQNTTVGPREEEILAIWEREKSRLVRDIKARERAKAGDVDAFESAVED